MADIYNFSNLSEESTDKNPFALFESWFTFAMERGLRDANAMVLSTLGENNIPSSRVVLLKEFSEKGFVFFTNYNSAKARELLANPSLSLVFFWPDLEKQIRVKGTAVKTTPEESDLYFHSRPLESRISAFISPQSEIVPDRTFLEEKFKKTELEYGVNITRPDHWGGFRISPSYFEFWQGRPGRLHDRLSYTLRDGLWEINRLAP
jgi:pyridoxamine 5'-phosphate oxidase